MSSVNSTKSYILLFANFDSLYQTWQFFINLEVFRTAKSMHFRPRHTHTHTKNPKAVVSGYSRSVRDTIVFFFGVRRCL